MRDLKARDIMITDVMKADSDEIVASAKLRMMRHGIGGLPVVENDKLVGVITHRDIILAGEEVVGLKVGDIMSKDVSSINEDADLKEITKLMRKTGYQRLPVVEGDKIKGIVTQSCSSTPLPSICDGHDYINN
ncbi:MAG: CBS domain-containing protein [Candidatus Hydrothermarchaeales archaeon]